uniref:Uncharacterized protein n=1 Tax=viral metagenome TaxID=1070528 RepID=A0A6C0D9Y4_9ZZZZ
MAFFLPALAINAILTKIRVDLENNLNREKANNKIYNVDKKRLEHNFDKTKKYYDTTIRTKTVEVKDLTGKYNDLIIRKDNMNNILNNNISAIEPTGYTPTKTIENFECPYSDTVDSGIFGGTGGTGGSSGTSGTGSSSGTGGSSGATGASGSGGSATIYDPKPYYTEDLEKKKQAEEKNTSDSFYKKYKYIFEQNSILLERQQYINNQFTRHNDKFEFYSNYVDKLTIFSNILFYLYYILGFVVIFKLFFDTPELIIYYKIIIIIVIFIFPLIVYTIEMIIYNTWLFVYSFMYGNVYNNLSYSNKVVLNNTTDLTTNE